MLTLPLKKVMGYTEIIGLFDWPAGITPTGLPIKQASQAYGLYKCNK